MKRARRSASSSGTTTCGTSNAAASASRVMSSGVPPSPPVTIRWSTRAASRRTTSTMRSSLVGHRRAEDDLHAELLEPPGEPRRVRVLGVTGDDFVPDRQDGGEHMTSMTIRELDPERDAAGVVAVIREAIPTAVVSPRLVAASRAHDPRAVTAAAASSPRSTGASSGERLARFENLFSEDTELAFVLVDRGACASRRAGSARALYDARARARRALGPDASPDERLRERRRRCASRARAASSRSASQQEAVLDPRTVTELPAVGHRPAADRRRRPAPRARRRPRSDARHAVDRDDRRDPVRGVGAARARASALHRRGQLRRDGRRGRGRGVAALRRHETGRSPNMFTGTLRAYRGRGLGARREARLDPLGGRARHHARW